MRPNTAGRGLPAGKETSEQRMLYDGQVPKLTNDVPSWARRFARLGGKVRGCEKGFLGESMISVNELNGDNTRIRFIKDVVGVAFLVLGLGP